MFIKLYSQIKDTIYIYISPALNGLPPLSYFLNKFGTLWYSFLLQMLTKSQHIGESNIHEGFIFSHRDQIIFCKKIYTDV